MFVEKGLSSSCVQRRCYKHDPSCYRPISLLPVVSKILESFVFVQLSQHLENNNLLPDVQFGFRRGFSTQDVTTLLADDLLRAKDKGLFSGAVFLDLKKAFDTVHHDRLLRKMSQLGISGTSLDWFRDYLCDRFQCVRVGSKLSDSFPCKRGIPQGSRLGPLLFIIYTRDLPSVVRDL